MRAFTLQSGFVTTVPTKLIKAGETDLSFKDSLFVPDYRIQDTEHYYDQEVQELFKLFHDNNDVILDMKFRELVLRMFYRLFPGSSFVNWVRLQVDQRSVGYMHQRFLIESLAYVIHNRTRETGLFTYYQLLQANQTSRSIPHRANSMAEELSELSTSHHSFETTDFLVKWTRDTVSIADMLVSLHVIFGRRGGFSSVAMG